MIIISIINAKFVAESGKDLLYGFCMFFADAGDSVEADGVPASTRCKYNCMICNKGFITMSKLKQHLPSHTGDKPYQCEQCDMRFPYASSLKNHVLVHSGMACHPCETASAA